jgi:hypothetical protein
MPPYADQDLRVRLARHDQRVRALLPSPVSPSTESSTLTIPVPHSVPDIPVRGGTAGTPHLRMAKAAIPFSCDPPVDLHLSAAQLLSIVRRLYHALPAEPGPASIAQIRRYADRYRSIVEA